MKAETEEGEFVGALLKMDVFLDNYKDTPFYNSINTLANVNSKIRRTKRDGNCFYYSIVFLMLEHYCTPGHAALLINTLNTLNNDLLLSGVEDYLIKEFTDPIVSTLKAAATGESPNIEELDSIFWNYTVTYFRMVTSAYIKKHKEKYAGFIEGDVEEYCLKSVEASFQYAGEIEMIGIAESFGISFDVVCIEGGCMERLTRGEGEKIGCLLLMSEHFDILYT
ncbi:ubiquitin thioesterase protein OTUB1 [Nematocida major]|uniref:ubiquitin thioesterase protein OTUB1 n=1 Tax=Nematocida major TaxID=1912982 RepID=UPI002007AEF2|nr:ubiquitin thioesterase protein OTUB1 [Nematocida major]KAH9386166.1 ubiquitin thioesterase protein OTUB1 [Nematocida major]